MFGEDRPATSGTWFESCNEESGMVSLFCYNDTFAVNNSCELKTKKFRHLHLHGLLLLDIMQGSYTFFPLYLPQPLCYRLLEIE